MLSFYLAKQAGVNINEIRLKRAEERKSSKKKTKREKCKMQKCTGITFLHVGARTLLYKG